jgi:8-oxo-dGTP diphosphatase
MPTGRFYAGIFALIWSPDLEKYLILQRSKDRDHAPGVWECVTGRVDQGEGFEQALHREAQEELGVEIHFEFIVGAVHFYRGPRTPEYEMLGLVCFCSLDDPQNIHTSPEHAQYRWVSLPEVEEMLSREGPNVRFIHNAIQRAEGIRRHISVELRTYLSQAGLEVDLS